MLMTNTQFVGPAHPSAEQSDVVRWWADGRYRRFLAHGTRACFYRLQMASSGRCRTNLGELRSNIRSVAFQQ
jgi:hypothetical protein